MGTDYGRLPAGLPVPVDDGAADHLPGLRVPRLRLPASDHGSRDLATLASITANGVRTFTRKGELVPMSDGRPALYDARQARNWLIERGVQGLSARRA